MCELKYRKRIEDAIRGSLLGGAIGDALGYPVEFWSYDEITDYYGDAGITEYDYSLGEGNEEEMAVISDDTQMTMFTATGILEACANGCQIGDEELVYDYIWAHYKDWLHTQIESYDKEGASWLLELPGIYALRAPGGTCLNAIGGGIPGTMKAPINDRKGCGGIMRVAPVALWSGAHIGEEPWGTIGKFDWLGAEVAALTHGHSLGYIPSAALVHIIRRAVFGGCVLGDTLHDIVEECRMVMAELFEDDPYLPVFLEILDDAVEFSGNDASDIENIEALGEGWVAEETFGISLYCALRYSDDFSKAVIAAVNHGGDSDSTGAVTGNIVGALVGYENIEPNWKECLEFKDVLLELADSLFNSNNYDGM